MKRYIGKRLFSMLVTIFVIVTLTFFMMKAAPGSPFNSEKEVPPEILQSMKEFYGLDDPWYMQYLRYLKAVALWDFGPSFKYKSMSVNDIINNGFPVSAILGLEALAIAVGGGVLLGVTAALRHNRWQDYTSMVIAVIGISVPSFILATFLQYVFVDTLGLLPSARWGGFQHTILPALSLAALPLAFIARLTRSNMLEVLGQDYIKTAKAKGLDQQTIVVRHTIRNAILPVISFLGQLTAGVVTGSFVVEKIFGIPGLGNQFVTSITNRDYPVIMGVTVFFSVLLLLCIFLMDLAYRLIDPRIKLGSGKGDV